MTTRVKKTTTVCLQFVDVALLTCPLFQKFKVPTILAGKLLKYNSAWVPLFSSAVVNGSSKAIFLSMFVF